MRRGQSYLAARDLKVALPETRWMDRPKGSNKVVKTNPAEEKL